MGKFNISDKPETYEHGSANAVEEENQWRDMLFGWFVEPSFYEGKSDKLLRFDRLTRKMIKTHGPETVANMCTYSRNVLGMRSASCIVAAVLNDFTFEGKRDFYRRYFRRPDDVAELLSYIESNSGKPSHALIRGACGYVNSLDEYTLSKYRLNDKQWSMLDIVNVVHAKSGAISKLKNGTLELAETWENTAFEASDDNEKADMWADLVRNDKLGTMALTRNLRNILMYCQDAKYDDVFDIIEGRLKDTNAIKKSLMFPYRFYSAYKSILGSHGVTPRLYRVWSKHMKIREQENKIIDAIKYAFCNSIDNIPSFSGSTAIILDASESMNCTTISSNSVETPMSIGCIYATMLKLMNPDAELIAFASMAKRVDIDVNENNVFSLYDEVLKLKLGYATCLTPAIDLLSRHHDRVFIISDMQAMDRDLSCRSALEKYREKYGECEVYSFNLGQYAMSPFDDKGDGIIHLTALNDAIFKLIEIVESGSTIFDYINEFYAV